MSFSSDVKTELCRTGPDKPCCARAEAYGALLYGNTFTAREVRLITESESFAARLPQLLDRAFGLRFDRLPAAGERSCKDFVTALTRPEPTCKVLPCAARERRRRARPAEP